MHNYLIVNRIKGLAIKHKRLILYAVFGILTTGINFVSYYLCYNIVRIENVPATIIAWILAVAFAFITNKLWVFDSKCFDKKTLVHEIPTFFGARLITGILDVVIMYIAVDVMLWNPMVWKLVSNIIVIVLNYAASMLIIFTKRDSK